MKIFIIFLLAVLLILCSGCIQQQQQCQKNEDCVKVQTTCCSCNMGGEEKCVLKSNSSLYMPNNCQKDVMCLAMFNCKIKSCSCIQGSCEPLE